MSHVSTQDPQQLHAELERLQEELASRQSIYHYAHSAVSTAVGLLVAGAAAKLYWDTYKVWGWTKLPIFGFVATAVALGLFVYAAVHLRRGRRHWREELARHETLQQVKRALKLDDPAALLPPR